MVKELPKFKGYTVDERLRQFRKVVFHIKDPFKNQALTL